MEKINKRQKAIYDFIKERINDKGIAPSVREIGEAVGLRSTSSVQYNLNALEQAGYITRDANLKRTVRVVGAAKGVNHIPLVGTVTAGMPILATEIIEDYIAVSGVSGNNLFALRVKGESMINAHILDGDIVIVEQCPTAQNGDIVVALVGNENTLKRYFVDKENQKIRLHPENKTMKDIVVSNCKIQGVAVKVIKNLE